MVLGLGIAALRMVSELGSGQTATRPLIDVRGLLQLALSVPLSRCRCARGNGVVFRVICFLILCE